MKCANGLANLSARIASGDPEAIIDLHHQWAKRCLRLVQVATGLDEATSLDVVQETMLKAMKGMPAFSADAEGEQWLRRVLINAARNRLRSEIRNRRREHAVAESRSEMTEELTGTKETIQRLQHHLSRLEREAADLLRRRFVLGWTLERIGRELGLRPGAVDGRIRKALTQLKEDHDLA